MNITYRLRQFTRGFTAQIRPDDHQVLDQILTIPQRQLFERMPIDAQRHSLNVLDTLQNAGHTNTDLAVAALLHDVGKVAAGDAGAYLGLWLRGPMVIMEKIAPWLLPKVAVSTPSANWRYAVYVQNEHPQIGADWAQSAGCSPLSCWLIQHHQYKEQQYKSIDALDPQKLTLLKSLQQADDQN